MAMNADDIQSIHRFWFGDCVRDSAALKSQMQTWFRGSQALDDSIRQHFGHVFEQWQTIDPQSIEEPQALLAGVLVFDQFSRQCFRGTERAFAYDAVALAWLQAGLENGGADALHPIERAFFYMPLQHVEDASQQQLGVALFSQLAAGDESPYTPTLQSFADYAREHAAIVERFGRFPHRNEVLGRESTASEVQFLADGAKRYGQ